MAKTKEDEEREKKGEVKVEKKVEEAPPLPPHVIAFNELKNTINQLDKAAASKEARLITRTLRQITRVRRTLTVGLLRKTVEVFCLPQSPFRAEILQFLDKLPDDSVEMLDVDAGEPAAAGADAEVEKTPKAASPEVEIFLQLLAIILFIDRKDTQNAAACCTSALNRIHELNRRSLDQLSAKIYFYFSRAYEMEGRLADIRIALLAAHRTSSLRHDQVGQAMLINLLLRNYLSYNLYEQADALVRKAPFPDDHASNNQHARYLYYTGVIKAVQLEYTDSFRSLSHALRKAPTNTALGFRLTVQKLMVIVQLLMGEIPDRQQFFQKGMVSQLKPYLQITQAVRIGDLEMFRNVMQAEGKKFLADKTYTLIVRLRHNVIKTGLRKIHLTYSAISLQDVCSKLHLDSIEDAEFIVAKAIHDGVIDATIDHDSGTVVSKGSSNLYNTDEPQAQFHKRIAFCLDMHNQAVKAMRFPPNAHKKSSESLEERSKRLAQEQEELEDNEDDFGEFF